MENSPNVNNQNIEDNDNSSIKSSKSSKTSKTNMRQFIDNNMTKDLTQIISNGGDDKNENEGETNNGIPVSKEFNENVIKYLKFDDKIKEIEGSVRELRKKRDECEKIILKHLMELKKDYVSTSNGKLSLNTKETKGPVSKENIKTVLSKKINDTKIVEEILSEIENSRQVKTKTNIERNKDKPPKNTKKTQK